MADKVTQKNKKAQVITPAPFYIYIINIFFMKL